MTTTNTITTPGKDLVTVLPDDEFRELAGMSKSRPQTLTYKWDASRGPVLRALWEHGLFKDKSGLASAKLYAKARKYGYQGASSAMTMMLRGGDSDHRSNNGLDVAVERVTQGKRTYEIRLVALPDTWVKRLTQTGHPSTNGHHPPGTARDEAIANVDALKAALAQPVMEPAPDVPMGPATHEATEQAPPPDPEMSGVVPYFHLPEGVEATAMVAMAMLSQVAEIIRSATYAPQAEAQLKALKASVEETQRNLGARVDENTRLRAEIIKLKTRLQDAADLIAATQHERDGLRQRIMRVEGNLTAALKGDTANFVDEQVRREIRRIMEAKPQPANA